MPDPMPEQPEAQGPDTPVNVQRPEAGEQLV